jgi:hypothetical protein
VGTDIGFGFTLSLVGEALFANRRLGDPRQQGSERQLDSELRQEEI